jgi:hypothetical protein
MCGSPKVSNDRKSGSQKYEEVRLCANSLNGINWKYFEVFISLG